MSIDSLISPDVVRIGDVSVRKPTAGTLALCDFAKLSLLSGEGSSLPFFEALAFFFIHAKPIKEVRALVFDKSLGVSDNGCSVAFANAVLDWADEVEIGSVNELGETIGNLITEAMTPIVEPISDAVQEKEVSDVINSTSEEEEEKKMNAQDS